LVQLTTSSQHDLKLQFFSDVLHKLYGTNENITTRSMAYTYWTIEIYFIVKKSKLAEFRISHVEEPRNRLSLFDPRWEDPELKVKIYAMKDIDN